MKADLIRHRYNSDNKKGIIFMKKNAIIITFAAALCALTSCGKDYVKVSYTAFSQPHITYARRIDAEHIMEIRTAGLTAEDFESRIFEISLCRQFFSL